MFDGKTFFPVTGMPMRKIACMMRPFAEADPVPLAEAILKANSLVIAIGCQWSAISRERGAELAAATLRLTTES
jgi:hypothetical protein